VIGGVLALAIAAIAAAYAMMVIRSAPNRRDNLTFGALVAVDAAMNAWRGISVLSGESIVGSVVTLPCALGTIAMSVLTIEFLVGFPRRPAMRARTRALLVAWAIVGAAVVALVDWANDWSESISEWIFFAPATALIFVLGAFAWRRTANGGERTVIAVLWFRWGFGLLSYSCGPLLHIFEPLVWIETTVATLISCVVMSTAVLRTELFSIRSAAAEVITFALMALVVASGGIVSVTTVLNTIEPGTVQQALLVGATMVPLALAAAARAMYPRLEKRVLAPLDERRARRLAVQDELLPVEPTAAIDEATRRIAAIGDGARVTWRPAAALAPELAAALATGEPQRRPDAGDACFTVPALGFERALVGAFAITGGTIDRDTYLVARDLAARVALVIERARRSPSSKTRAGSPRSATSPPRSRTTSARRSPASRSTSRSCAASSRSPTTIASTSTSRSKSSRGSTDRSPRSSTSPSR
jgi:hypothetical protein